MKKLILAATLLVAACAAQLSAATVSLDVVSAPDAAGNFTLAVNVNDLFANYSSGDTFVSYGFTIAVNDPAKAQLTGFTVNSLFDDYSFLAGPNGVMAFATPPAGYAPGDLPAGPLTLALLQFSGLTLGNVDVTVATSLADLNTGLVFSPGGYEQFSTSTNVGAVPEPATAALAGVALIGLVALARRRRK